MKKLYFFVSICCQVIAHNSRTDEIVKLRTTFQKYDTAKNGVLSFDEFKAALHESDFSDELLQEVFESIVSFVRSKVCRQSICLLFLVVLLTRSNLCLPYCTGYQQEWAHHVHGIPRCDLGGTWKH